MISPWTRILGSVEFWWQLAHSFPFWVNHFPALPYWTFTREWQSLSWGTTSLWLSFCMWYFLGSFFRVTSSIFRFLGWGLESCFHIMRIFFVGLWYVQLSYQSPDIGFWVHSNTGWSLFNILCCISTAMHTVSLNFTTHTDYFYSNPISTTSALWLLLLSWTHTQLPCVYTLTPHE